MPRLYLLFAILLIPWTMYLGATLPTHTVAHHYRAAWVGFDLVLLLVLARIGWRAARRDPHVVLTATVGATMLCIDAWFDVMTAPAGEGRTESLLLAVLVELPVAVLCALLARGGLLSLLARAEQAADPTADPSAEQAGR